MKHRGEIVNERIRQSGLKITKIVGKLNISRSTLYAWIENPQLDWDSILEIGKIINYDFSKDFTEITSTVNVSEPLSDYKKTTLPECLKERDEWKDKYISLLESHNLILKGELGKYLAQ
jgi:hypothetical protein